MTSDPAQANGAPDEPLRDAMHALTVERHRTVDECDTFSGFHDRVRDMDVVEPSPPQGPGLQIQTSTIPGLAAVRDAYEETVMSVPHYDEEYGDDYANSVEAEFGPDVAAALVDGRFGEYCKQSLLTKTEQARDERERFLATLDVEQESLEHAETRIHDVLDRVMVVVDEEYEELSFAALEDIRSTLLDLRAECDELVADRQAAIRRQRRQMWVPRSSADVPAYVYQELDETYPALSAIADLGECISKHRQIVERAMAWAE